MCYCEALIPVDFNGIIFRNCATNRLPLWFSMLNFAECVVDYAILEIPR